MRMLNKCMNSRSWNSRRGFSLVLAVLILLFFVAFASYGFAETAVLSTIILLIGIGLFSCFVFCIVVEGRMYVADEKGITISYVCVGLLGITMQPNAEPIAVACAFAGVVIAVVGCFVKDK